ncbi:3-deoxy-D-manno-octulosonic acid transferase [Hydrogenovibrio crunogenus]|uniref:3-deoxy-D-manno-octulosonic acid transferase n=1 Tax=Hydrogenovibrio crunogenus TaxID=39765 RepID=A0A4P7NXM6_9GAMM|nr:3-deoxy-D-manno-octulosonic acid transferase [Hydrogenovibrio crunogenus]QBZ82503.1 3-deoxy-D-manno-octulosonic acid transferase [Hydrogenovibrio crunogenus]
MSLWLYRFLLILASPLIAYSGWKRCHRAKKQAEKDSDYAPIPHCFAARFGWSRQPFQQGGIWVHAVSVGETRSIFPLLTALKKTYPDLPITVTNGSTQGAQQALRFAPIPIQHQMIPYDYPGAVKRFLKKLQPRLVIMVETEIWPNLYQACWDQQIPLILANARVKEKSFYAYQKWGGKLIANALNQTRLIASQFALDTDHLIALGAHPARIKQLGNLKFDIHIPKDLMTDMQQWRQEYGLENKFIWVAASTHAEEETLMLEAHQQLRQQHPNALLILVPRHTDRFLEVADLLSDKHIPFASRSKDELIQSDTQVYLADTIGELMNWFAACDAAFIGGSLVPFGGHNILEPAALKKPVLSGQYHQNLQALYDSFKQDEAILISQDENELAQQLIQLADSPEWRNQKAEEAYACFEKQSGALPKLMHEIGQLLPPTE